MNWWIVQTLLHMTHNGTPVLLSCLLFFSPSLLFPLRNVLCTRLYVSLNAWAVPACRTADRCTVPPGPCPAVGRVSRYTNLSGTAKRLFSQRNLNLPSLLLLLLRVNKRRLSSYTIICWFPSEFVVLFRLYTSAGLCSGRRWGRCSNSENWSIFCACRKRPHTT